MTFNKKITLLKIVNQNGSGNQTVETSRVIRANVRDMGMTLKYSAVAAGQNAELQVICHRAEFADTGYTHADVSGQRYRITGTGAADNERHIKLILAKGK